MISLSPLNTLHLPIQTENLIEISSPSDLQKVDISKPYLILGTGANILFTKDFPGTIILNKLKNRKIIAETDNDITIEFASGESWHDAVTWAVDHNYSGMENMALIPGTIGAAAVGNIAAYGQNQEDIFISLQATNLKTQESKIFGKEDMKFTYRESFLKHQTNYFVTSVTYQLSKTAHLELSYHATRHASLLPTLQTLKGATASKTPAGGTTPKGKVAENVFAADTPEYSIKDVYNAVIKLRTEKLPDPKNIGTAGSFFKNPVVSKQKAEQIKLTIPELQTYPVSKLQYQDSDDDFVKLPAGMLLDKLGWRGKKKGNVGTFPTHALTVVAYPGATGQEVYDFAESMRIDVKKNFGIDLEYEVVIV